MSSPTSDQSDSDFPFIVGDIDVPRVLFNTQIISNVQIVHESIQPEQDDGVVQRHSNLKSVQREAQENAAARISEFPSASAILASDDEDLSDLATCFENSNQAKLYHQSLIPMNGEYDATIPTTDNKKRALVQILTTAFKSIELATDNKKELDLFLKSKHDVRLVEVVCWRILDTCITRSIKGPLCKGFNKDRTKSATTPMSFAERFDNAVKVMVLYKGCCKNLFKPLFLEEFIDNPLFHLGRSITNKRGNKNRQTQIKLGKALEEGAGDDEDSNNDDHGREIENQITHLLTEEDVADEDSPSPPKRARKAPKAKASTTKAKGTPTKKRKETVTGSSRKRMTRSVRTESSITPPDQESSNTTTEESHNDMLALNESTQAMGMTTSPVPIEDDMVFAHPLTDYAGVPVYDELFQSFGHSSSMPSLPTYQPDSFSSFGSNFFELTPFPLYDGLGIDGQTTGEVHDAGEDYKTEQPEYLTMGYNPQHSLDAE